MNKFENSRFTPKIQKQARKFEIYPENLETNSKIRKLARKFEIYPENLETSSKILFFGQKFIKPQFLIFFQKNDNDKNFLSQKNEKNWQNKLIIKNPKKINRKLPSSTFLPFHYNFSIISIIIN